jgi:carboxypeptidase PM20D1
MARKFLLGGLAVLVAVACAVVYKAATLESKQVAVAPAPRVEFDVEAATERLARAVTFKTISYQDPTDFDGAEFDGLHAFLAESFPRVHATLTREKVSNWSLLYTWMGTDPALKPIVLMAHLDVVPVVPGTEGDWEHDAYSGAITDGFIYGRGTMDDKSSAMAILESVEKLIEQGRQPVRTIYLAFGHDEEVGGALGAAAIVELMKSRGIAPEFVLDEGGVIVSGAMPGIEAPVATVGVAEKGYMTVKLTVNVDGGHSSQPPRETAIGIMSEAITRLQDRQMPGGIDGLSADMLAHVGPEMPFGLRIAMGNLWLFAPIIERQFAASPVMNAFLRTTTAPTIIQGGTKENVLPPEVSAIVNFRILPGDSREDVVDHIVRVVDDERVAVEPFMDQAVEASKVSPSEGPHFELIERTIREVAPGTVVTPYLVIGATDARKFEVICDNVYRFLPMPILNDDLKRMHGTNERIAIETYATMLQFYHRLIENAAMQGEIEGF